MVEVAGHYDVFMAVDSKDKLRNTVLYPGVESLLLVGWNVVWGVLTTNDMNSYPSVRGDAPLCVVFVASNLLVSTELFTDSLPKAALPAWVGLLTLVREDLDTV